MNSAAGRGILATFSHGAALDLGDITQLVLVATTALVLGRVGLALARLIERRSAGQPGLAGEAEERLRILEDECLNLRQEITELHERQDFTERALLPAPAPARPAPSEAPPERVVTPH
jgi:hypothetical protein